MLGALSSHEVEHLLASAWVARLGLHADGLTYVVPISYAYDGHAVYAHSNEGLKLRLLHANPSVCVEVDEVDGLFNWKSVIAWGRFEELHGDAAREAMHLIMRRFAAPVAEQGSVPTHWRPSPEEADESTPCAVAYKIVLERKTGRFERR